MHGENITEVRYAGFWIRFLASIVDTVILALPLILVVYILSGGEWFDFLKMHQGVEYANSGEAMNALKSAKAVQMKWEMVFELLMAAVIIIFWKRWAGATPGKRLLGIHVVDFKTGLKISNSQAVVRYIGYIASSIILMIGFLMVAFRRDKRALHDLMAGTAVVYKKG